MAAASFFVLFLRSVRRRRALRYLYNRTLIILYYTIAKCLNVISNVCRYQNTFTTRYNNTSTHYYIYRHRNKSVNGVQTYLMRAFGGGGAAPTKVIMCDNMVDCRLPLTRAQTEINTCNNFYYHLLHVTLR